ncbi:NACHT domain-containing NTPase [Vibrio harveyi]
MSIEAVTVAGVSEAFKFAIGELYDVLKRKSSKFQEPNISLINAYRNAILVEQVKTIWQVDKPVNLNNFYYPSKLIVDEKAIAINSLSDLPPDAKCVIEGTAGQGKSIFLRYLSGYELRKGKSVPLFVELRKVSDKKSVEQLICDALSDLGIDTEVQQLDIIFGTGKFTLLLDAFDEIPELQVKDTITFIESLCNKHHLLRILISSRPDSSIQNSSLFNIFKLSPISPSDFRPILDKFFFEDKDIIDDIVTSIHKSGSNIAELITTPLLLTLLTITYKGYNKIPDSPHEFYENLFHLLVNRHDATKPGFIRDYSSKLNENQLEKLFHAFCFYCMLEQKVSLSRAESVSLTRSASSNVKIVPFSESSFVSDCVKNTCLIVEEGSDFHFIHKSIREYHSARFIKDSDLFLKKKFYSSSVNNSNKYSEELKYLKEIDQNCFEEFFLIPSIQNNLDYFKWNGKNPDLSSFSQDLTIHMRCKSEKEYIVGGVAITGKTPLNGYLDLFSFIIRSTEKYLLSNEFISDCDFSICTESRLNSYESLEMKIIGNSEFIKKASVAIQAKCIELEQQLNDLKLKIEDRKSSIESISF